MSKILIVDDQEKSRQFLQKILRDQSHDLLIARNGNEGVHLVKKHKDLDLVLLDDLMQEVDGLQFLRSIRTFPRSRELRVIMIGDTRFEGVRLLEAQRLGVELFFQKGGLDTKKFINSINQITRGSSPSLIQKSQRSINLGEGVLRPTPGDKRKKERQWEKVTNSVKAEDLDRVLREEATMDYYDLNKATSSVSQDKKSEETTNSSRREIPVTLEMEIPKGATDDDILNGLSELSVRADSLQRLTVQQGFVPRILALRITLAFPERYRVRR